MSGTLTPPGVPVTALAYEDFQGIDTSRDEEAQETGKKQSLLQMINCYCDWRGAVNLEGGATRRGTNDRIINHLTFFGHDLVCWAQQDGGGVTLKSERGHEQTEVYPINSVVTSTIFNGKAHFASRGQNMYAYNGFVWKRTKDDKTDPKPAFIAAVQRRLFAAGLPNSKTQILASRADDETVFPENETLSLSDVLRAADVEIGNIIGSSDEIMGISKFETNRLAVFTQDQTLVYKVHPDYTQWDLDEKVNVNVGTISHNSIIEAGNDLMFCAREGVYSMKRSDVNGVTVFSVPLSDKVRTLYRSLVRRVANTQDITAYFDQDLRQYHVMFPINDKLCKRLVVTMSPSKEVEHKWSLGDFLNMRCIAGLGGSTVAGTSGGLYDLIQADIPADITPTGSFETPVLWQGTISDTKESMALIVQAAGKGSLLIEAFDNEGQKIDSMTFEIRPDAVDDAYYDVPLSSQYSRPFFHKYLGLKLKFTITGSGIVRVTGVAVLIRKKK